MPVFECTESVEQARRDLAAAIAALDEALELCWKRGWRKEAATIAVARERWRHEYIELVERHGLRGRDAN